MFSRNSFHDLDSSSSVSPLMGAENHETTNARATSSAVLRTQQAGRYSVHEIEPVTSKRCSLRDTYRRNFGSTTKIKLTQHNKMDAP